MSLSTLFKSNVTVNAHTSEDFLKLTRKCMERVQKMTSKGIMFSPPKFNYDQCKYLADKLKLVLESAETLPLAGITNCFEVIKLVHGFAIVVETIIQRCRQDRWIQAAVTMTNISECIKSIGFYLEAISQSFLGVLTLTSVDDIYQSEVRIVEEKASSDRETLLRNLSALLQTKPTTWEVYQLATLLLEGLEHPHHRTGSIPRFFQDDKDNLMVKEQLGRGSFATVFKASCLGIEVAKKTFFVRDSPDFEHEVSILQTLSHPNIASLFGYAKDDQECFMIMELMDEDLFRLIRRRMKENKKRGYPFDIMEAMDLMLQIGGGMKYLHEMRIVHRDLKSMNILVKYVKTRDSKIAYVLAKVSDFGLSKIKQNSLTQSYQTPNLGTARWMAPEMIKRDLAGSSIEISNVDANEAEVAKHPFKSDVYSFAMVCYEILSGEMPYFEEPFLNEVKKKVLKGDRPPLPSHCPPTMKSLMEKCWNADASKRPSFTEIFAELRQLQCGLLLACMTFYKMRIQVGTSSGEFKWGIQGTKFTIGELSMITNDFSASSKIRDGRFGTFYRGVLPDGTLLAVWRSRPNSYRKNFNMIQAEIESLSIRKAHPNLLQLVGDCVTPNECFLVYPHISNGTVRSQLQKGVYGEPALSFKMRKHIALGVAKGLAYLHEECNPEIVHYIVQSDTILLDDKYEALISGFAFCEVIGLEPEPLRLIQRTWHRMEPHYMARGYMERGYMAPEYLIDGEVSENADVYSYGIVLLELITARDVQSYFETLNSYSYLNDWVKDQLSSKNLDIHESDLRRIVDSELWEYNLTEMKDLLQVALSCIQKSPSTRPKISEVVKMLQPKQP